MPTNLDNLSPTKRDQLAYWTAFCEYMARHSPIPYRLELDPEKPTYWVQFPEELFNRSAQIRLGAHIYLREKYISVVLHLRGPKAKQRFDSLFREKEQIEKEIGAGPDWQRERGQKISEIILENPDVNPKNERDWPRQHAWLMEKLEAFNMAFAPRIRRL